MKNKTQLRTKKVNIRFTETEIEIIEKEMKQREITSFSEFIRIRLKEEGVLE